MMKKCIENKVNSSRSKQESGAIMLEVIAVLSLMGLMGTMLFRQIYMRNQELTNIQMASEIRMVKEAFSAWLQANPQDLSGCLVPENGDAIICPAAAIGTIASLREKVDDYLPISHQGLVNDYNLYVRCEEVGGNRRCYGIVIPLKDTLPDDWNFKRAARVAVLTGMDGGVYDVDEDGLSLTSKEFRGSMGSWSLAPDSMEPNYTTFLATTGIDVFHPELEAQKISVNLPGEIDIVTRNTQVYGNFVAGLNSCYTILHDATDLAAGDEVAKDVTWNVGSACQPAFLVEGNDPKGTSEATGNVRVLNDLSVGYDYQNQVSAMRFDKDGMIVFEKATVIDPQSTKAAGHKDINYLLDPKYTSVMNDIKIMSRGGARLSEILPNYILKTQQTLECTIAGNTLCRSDVSLNACKCEKEVTKPGCPNGYSLAMVVIPQNLAGATQIQRIVMNAGSSNQMRVYGVHTNVFKPFIQFGDKNDDPSSGIWSLVYGFMPNASAFPYTTYNSSYGFYSNATDGASNNEADGAKMFKLWQDRDIVVVVQTYCVFDPNNIDWDGNGSVNSSDHSPATARTMDDDTCGRIKSQSVCVNMGCVWSSSVCRAP